MTCLLAPCHSGRSLDPSGAAPLCDTACVCVASMPGLCAEAARPLDPLASAGAPPPTGRRFRPPCSRPPARPFGGPTWEGAPGGLDAIAAGRPLSRAPVEGGARTPCPGAVPSWTIARILFAPGRLFAVRRGGLHDHGPAFAFRDAALSGPSSKEQRVHHGGAPGPLSHEGHGGLFKPPAARWTWITTERAFSGAARSADMRERLGAAHPSPRRCPRPAAPRSVGAPAFPRPARPHESIAFTRPSVHIIL